MHTTSCSTLICEGYNEKIYFENILVDPCSVLFPKIKSEEGKKKTVKIIVNKSLSVYFSSLKGGICKKIVVYNGGIDTILKYLLPSLISKSVNTYGILSLKILLDDAGNPNEIIEKFKETVMAQLSLWHTNGKYCLNEDNGWYIIDYLINNKKISTVKIKILFVPISLEKQIVNKSIILHKKLFGGKKCKELDCQDPHEAITEISKILKGKSYDPEKDSKYCIELSSKEKWFFKEKWHEVIINEI